MMAFGFFTKIIYMDVNFQMKLILINLELYNSIYKGSNRYNTGQIFYITVMGDFRYVNGKTGCSFHHESYNSMS
jgi:hypothetical protein